MVMPAPTAEKPNIASPSKAVGGPAAEGSDDWQGTFASLLVASQTVVVAVAVTVGVD